MFGTIAGASALPIPAPRSCNTGETAEAAGDKPAEVCIGASFQRGVTSTGWTLTPSAGWLMRGGTTV